MPQFDDLVADLLRENLLDDSIINAQKVSNDFDLPKLPNSPKPTIGQHKTFFDAASYEMEVPDFAYILSEGNSVSKTEADNFHIFPIPLEPADNSLISPQDSFINIQGSLKQSGKRRKAKKIKLNGKYCPYCKLTFNRTHLYCRFCQNRILGDRYYYLLIILSMSLFAVAIGLFIMFKLPK